MNSEIPSATTTAAANVPVVGSLFEIFFPFQKPTYRQSIYLASFPDIIYLWPTMLVFLIGYLAQMTGIVTPVTIGWIAIIVFGINVIVMVQDLDQRKFTVLMLLLISAFLGIWILSLYGFSFFKSIADAILELQPSFSDHALLILGVLLLVLFFWGVVTPLFNYWKFENNEFVHYTQPIGKDMSIARIGCTVYKEVPDVLEYLLTWGGGTLVIRRDNTVLATIPNVPFLGKRMIAIERMLSETRVTISPERE